MKSPIFLTVMFVLTALWTGCSGIITLNKDINPVLITELDGMSDEYIAKLKTDGILVKFDKGDVLPVEVTSQLPFATLESGQNQLVFSQTSYLYLCKDGAYISPDGIRFAPVYDGKALRKLYNAEQGTFSIGFAMTKEEGAKLKTDVSLK